MPTATIRPNILHNYANYTYHLQLWAITAQAFNGIGKGAISPGQEDRILDGGKLLISNGGFSKEDTERRDQNFPFDFVLDNIEIETLVGNKTNRSRGVDALSLKFDIIEPYTVTLLDRLIRLSLSTGVGPDFKTLIYALKIQFYGYDDMGKPQAVDRTTKIIPFSLLNMEFSVTQKGAVYKCQGMPTQNLVMTMLDNNIPFHVDLEGQTIKDLFDSRSTTPGGAATARTDRVAAPFNSSSRVTKGIAFALNENEKFKVENDTQKDANEYVFDFAPELENARIVDPNKIQDISRAFSNIKGAQGLQIAQQGRVGALTIDANNVKMSAQAGTKITDFINSALSISSYMTDQVKRTPDKSKPLKLWKIFPKMEIKNYDSKLNFYSRKVTYVVRPYEFYGEDHPNFGQKTLEQGALVKEYDYIFTGLNKDVIKANLDFKVAFWEVRNGVKENYTENIPDGTGKEGSTEVMPDNATDRRRWGIAGILNTNGLANHQNSGGATNKLETIAVGEIMSKLMDNGVDLINLDIEIVGDPDWIQQDNILYGTNVPANQKTLNNGTITYHDSVTCFRFNFKSPVKDYDDLSGLLKLGDATETSSFSGLYQVLTVTSNFRRGKFTQKLNNIRLRLQDEKETGVARTSGAAAAAPAENRANNNTTTPNQGTPADFVVGTVLG